MCLVSLCIQDASLRIWFVLSSTAYTISFFKTRERTMQPSWVTLDSPTTMFKDRPSLHRWIPYLSTHNHPRKHGRSRVSQLHGNQEVIIAHGNGRFTIDNFFIVWELNLLLKNWAGLFFSLKFALFKWSFSSTLHIHAPLMPVTTLYSSFPQVHAAHSLKAGLHA